MPDPKKLPGRILKQKATVSQSVQGFPALNPDLVTEEPPTNDSWQKKDTGKLGNMIKTFQTETLSKKDEEKVKKCVSAYDYYQLFSPPSWVKNVVHESKVYGMSRGFSADTINSVNNDTYRCTEAFFLWSGFNGTSQLRQNWETTPELRSDFIASNFRRTEVEAVLRCLHYRDNKDMNSDRYYKIRPIFDVLNSGSRFFLPLIQHFSVDEAMIPYFGRHGTKQYIFGKPVKYGFKGDVKTFYLSIHKHRKFILDNS